MPRSTPPAARPAATRATRRRPAPRSLLADVHPRHRVWGKVLALFDGLWGVLRWVWSSVVVSGLLAGPLFALLTSGTTGLTDWHTWPVIKLIQARPLVSVGALGGLGVMTILAF